MSLLIKIRQRMRKKLEHRLHHDARLFDQNMKENETNWNNISTLMRPATGMSRLAKVMVAATGRLGIIF